MLWNRIALCDLFHGEIFLSLSQSKTIYRQCAICNDKDNL
jgi:hypothetical protein